MGIQQMFLGVGAGGDYQVAKSLRFNDDDSAYLGRTLASTGSATTGTYSFWFKRSKVHTGMERIIHVGTYSSGAGYPSFHIGFNNDNVVMHCYLNGYTLALQTSAKFRDYSAWYHIVCTLDSTQNTNTDRGAIYVNGVLQDYAATTWPSQNDNVLINTNTSPCWIGRRNTSVTKLIDGYLADLHFIDGTALDPTSFAETNADTGQWVPIKYSGSHGTNGYHLKFDNTSDLGEDSAGSNDWTANNLSTSAGGGNDSLTDTPTNYGDDTGLGGEVRGNYAVLNPLVNSRFSGNYTLSNGNLKTVHTGYATLPSTLAVSSGKWYCEGTLDVVANYSNQAWCGLMRVDAEAHWTGSSPYQNIPIEYWQGNTPLYGVNFWGDGLGLNRTQSYGSSYATAGTVIGIAFNADSGSCTWYINGSSQGSSTYNIVQGETYYFVFGAALNGSWTANFGARPFAYAAPSGYKCLCAQNLSDPTIADSSSHFDVATASGANILSTATGLTDGADFVWIKDRDNSVKHILFNRINDSGMDGTPHMRSDTTDNESSCGTYSAPSGNSVSWVWNAGSSTVTNTDGSITSSVRANTDAGFSIVSYTGTGSSATVGHGLGATPGLLITKGRDGSGLSWATQFMGSASNYMQMQDTSANSSGDGSAAWGSDPTSSVFSINTKPTSNDSGIDFIAFVWSEVEGYSKFGKYYGGGGTYGYPFCWTGFKPAFVMIKCGTAGQSWIMWDSERSTYNVADEILNADNTNTEAAWSDIDILSNGFKIRDTHASVNTRNNWYYFAAFAETPLKYSNAR